MLHTPLQTAPLEESLYPTGQAHRAPQASSTHTWLQPPFFTEQIRPAGGATWLSDTRTRNKSDIILRWINSSSIRQCVAAFSFIAVHKPTACYGLIAAIWAVKLPITPLFSRQTRTLRTAHAAFTTLTCKRHAALQQFLIPFVFHLLTSTQRPLTHVFHQLLFMLDWILNGTILE